MTSTERSSTKPSGNSPPPIFTASPTRRPVLRARHRAGSQQVKAATFQELLDNAVGTFVAVLQPHRSLPAAELERRCIGLVGAGEVPSAALVRGNGSEAETAAMFAALTVSELNSPVR